MRASRSDSVFSGIQAGEPSEGAGERRGEMRMKAPRIQNGGKTEERRSGTWYGSIERKERTKAKLEKVHSQSNRLSLDLVFRWGQIVRRECLGRDRDSAVMATFAGRRRG